MAQSHVHYFWMDQIIHRIKAFIQALDEKAWRMVLIGRKQLMTKDNKGNTSLTPKVKWLTDDDMLANYNSKALNVIFNGVGADQIKLITTCESTKEAWEILQITFEGNSDVKRSKLLMLTTRFEELCMKNDETLSDFYLGLYDIANEFHSW